MPADGKAFLDTNVLIYAFAKGDRRSDAAEALLLKGGVIGVQTLNEFVAVAARELAMPWKEILAALSAIRVLFPSPALLTIKTHDRALSIAGRHRLHIYDALIVAAALESACKVLYSEDMAHGQVIDGLTIRNPFRSL
jgi:predicted nucleic acid-binding protein